MFTPQCVSRVRGITCACINKVTSFGRQILMILRKLSGNQGCFAGLHKRSWGALAAAFTGRDWRQSISAHTQI